LLSATFFNSSKSTAKAEEQSVKKIKSASSGLKNRKNIICSLSTPYLMTYGIPSQLPFLVTGAECKRESQWLFGKKAHFQVLSVRAWFVRGKGWARLPKVFSTGDSSWASAPCHSCYRLILVNRFLVADVLGRRKMKYRLSLLVTVVTLLLTYSVNTRAAEIQLKGATLTPIRSVTLDANSKSAPETPT
jgi:hypothetical protein